MARLLTMLGIANYEPVSYYLAADPARAYETRYAPVATARLAGPVDDAAVLVTADARMKHWEGCQQALAELGVQARAFDIPEGRSDEEIWRIFQAILDATADEAEVLVDVTFSFRHLPFVLLASLTYLTALRGVKVRGPFYGAYEARANGRVPILDLGPLLTLSDWYHAVRTFADTGNPRHLPPLVRTVQSQLARDGRPEPPLNTLRSALEGLAWTVPSGLPLEAGLEAARAVGAVEALLHAGTRSPMVETVLEPLARTVGGIALAPGVSRKADIALTEGELRRQLSLVRAYAERGQTDRALLLLREWIINRCILAREDLARAWLDFSTARRPMEHALNALAARRELEADKAPDELGGLWLRIRDRRNAIAHAGFSKNAVNENRQEVLRLLEACDAHLADGTYWRTAVPGRLGRVLVTPLGLSPGVLFTALKRLHPGEVLVITSPDAEGLASEAAARADWRPAGVARFVVPDAHGCFDQVDALLAWARPVLLEAAEVLVNVTGGTTGMQYLVERVAGEAVRLGVPTTRYALLDRRSPEEQRREPYVLGEAVALRGDEPTPDE